MTNRVIIEKIFHGYAVKSFDLDTNIYETFEGKGALRRAIKHCKDSHYEILNIPSLISIKQQGGLPQEINDATRISRN